MPEKKEVSSMADFFSNICLMDCRYWLMLCFVRFESGSFTRNQKAMMMGITTTGKNRKVAYHVIRAISEPNTGLRTFPKPLPASMIPKDLLLSLPVKRSPHNAMAMGAVPAAPIPCSTLPPKITA